MRAIFKVIDISLADTPVRCRRGVVFLEGDAASGRWHVVVWDPRAEALRAAVGLELPFSARTADGIFLTGWVSIGDGDAEVGMQYLQGMGKLGVRRPWHTLPARVRNTMRARTEEARQGTARRRGHLPRPEGDASGPHEPADKPTSWRRPRVPGVLRSLSSGQRLVVVVALTFSCWGLLSLALDIGRSTKIPTATAAAEVAPGTGEPILGSRVAIIEHLGFDKRYVRLRDTLAISILRADGVTELYALLPGGRRALATLNGECVVVMRDLIGRRTERRALVHTTSVSDAHVYLSGWLSPR